MDDDKTYEKLEEISKCQANMRVTLAKNTVILGEHVRRTEVAEKRIDNMEINLDKKADRSYITWALGIVTALISITVLLGRLI